MQETLNSKVFSLVEFLKSFHLYSRYQIAKSLKSALIFGEDFGDARILKLAKEDFLGHEKVYRDVSGEQADGEVYTDKQQNPYGGVFAFGASVQDTEDVQSVAFKMEIFASKKKRSDFLGKDYILDISPESLFVIFPDLTFVAEIQSLAELSWEEVRAELQEANLLDKDMAHLSGEAVSVDELRKKLKDTSSTDGALIDLRKKMYSLAYAINESFQNQIEHYEK